MTPRTWAFITLVFGCSLIYSIVAAIEGGIWHPYAFAIIATIGATLLSGTKVLLAEGDENVRKRVQEEEHKNRLAEQERKRVKHYTLTDEEADLIESLRKDGIAQARLRRV